MRSYVTSRVPVDSVVAIGVSLLEFVSRGIPTRIDLAARSAANRRMGACPCRTIAQVPCQPGNASLSPDSRPRQRLVGPRVESCHGPPTRGGRRGERADGYVASDHVPSAAT